MRLLVCVIPVAMLLSGCGETDPNKVEISGTVSYQNDPVVDGRIRFSPTEGTSAPVAGGVIKDGKFTITSKGGVRYGTYRVEITAFFPLIDDPSAEPLGPMDLPPREQLLPKKYNTESTLERTISIDGPTVLDFDLQ